MIKNTSKTMKISLLLSALILLLNLTYCGGPAKRVTVLKLAHVLPTTHPVHISMDFMASELKKNSNGRMSIEIYPSGVLGNERECLESLQIGSLDMTKVSSAVLENFVPSFSVLSLPYLFRDKTHRWKVFDSDIGQKMLLDGENQWLRGLCFYESGERNFYLADKKVEKPEDLRGLKVRVMRSNLSIRGVEALGANSAPIAFGELFTAIAAGVVDGAENNIPTIHQSKHFEIVKYICLDGHSAPSDVLLISTHTWKRLNNQEKEWLKKAVKASLKKQIELWDASTEEALKDFESHGIEVIRPDKAPFVRAVQPLYDELKDAGDPLYDMAIQIREML